MGFEAGRDHRLGGAADYNGREVHGPDQLAQFVISVNVTGVEDDGSVATS